MNDKEKEIELIKYLRDLSEKESDRFWTRNNVFVTINAGLIAFMASSFSSLDVFIISIISLFGIFISLAWWQILRTGKYYAQRWRNASRSLAKQNEYIIENVSILAGKIEDKQPRGPKSSQCMKWLAIFTSLIWLSIGIYVLTNGSKSIKTNPNEMNDHLYNNQIYKNQTYYYENKDTIK